MKTVRHALTIGVATAALAFPGAAETPRDSNDATSGLNLQTSGGIDSHQPVADIQAQTGTLNFNPVYAARYREQVFEIDKIELVFSRVERQEDGSVFPSTQPDQYTAIIDAAEREYAAQTLDMPAGTYALSQINYDWKDRPRYSSGQSFTSSGFGARQRTTAYCLSDATISFDITGGEDTHLGEVGLLELPSNTGRFSRHRPLASISSDLSATGEEDAALEALDYDETTFSAESHFCEDTDYQIAGYGVE